MPGTALPSTTLPNISCPVRLPAVIRFFALLPGVALAVAVAIAARLTHALLPVALQPTLAEVLFAVFFGLLVGNLLVLGGDALVRSVGPGIRFSFRPLLRVAIVLLGARLSLGEIAAIGGQALVLVVLLMCLALVTAHTVGRVLRVPPRLATLIGVGTSVCGNSAISATAPVIGARDDEVSFAVATNTLLGTAAVFAYPLIGRALGFDDPTFGTWAGTAINDTSQVVAAGFAYSQPAGEVATTVKLTRNALMGFVIVAVGFLHASDRDVDDPANPPLRHTWAERLQQSLPLFVLGFLALAVANSVGLLDALSNLVGVDVQAWCATASKALVLVALAGVGLGTRVATLRATGPKPFLLGVTAALATSLGSLLLIALLGPAGG